MLEIMKNSYSSYCFLWLTVHDAVGHLYLGCLQISPDGYGYMYITKMTKAIGLYCNVNDAKFCSPSDAEEAVGCW